MSIRRIVVVGDSISQLRPRRRWWRRRRTEPTPGPGLWAEDVARKLAEHGLDTGSRLMVIGEDGVPRPYYVTNQTSTLTERELWGPTEQEKP